MSQRLSVNGNFEQAFLGHETNAVLLENLKQNRDIQIRLMVADKDVMSFGIDVSHVRFNLYVCKANSCLTPLDSPVVILFRGTVLRVNTHHFITIVDCYAPQEEYEKYTSKTSAFLIVFTQA